MLRTEASIPWVILMLLVPILAQAGSLPDTGQTTSYTETSGEDSDYTINPPLVHQAGRVRQWIV